MTSPLALSFLLAASAIWAEPSCVDPEGGFVPGRSMETARVYGARGETVSFWVSVQAGRKPVEGLLPAMEAPGRGFVPPVVWEVEAIAVQSPEGDLRSVLDRLRPPEPENLARDEIARYWVSLPIPLDAPAGVEQGELRFDTNTRQRFRLPLRVEVFDFAVPPVTAYPLLVPLDRAALARESVLDDGLPASRGIYNLLGRYGLSPVLWDDGALFQTLDAREAVAHAAHALRDGRAPVVDLGGTGITTKLLQPSRAVLNRADFSRLGPLRDGLVAEGLADSSVLRYTVPESRDDWRRLTAFLEQHAVRAPEIRRVLDGPVAFPLMQHADAWAVPFRALTPALGDALARPSSGLDRGLSVHLVQAAASGAWEGYETLPSDAFDGNVFTGWVPPATEVPTPLEAHLAAPEELKLIDIVWLGEHVAREIEVWTSRDGFKFSQATVDWEARAGQAALGHPAVHRGSFKYPQSMIAFRLTVARPVVEDGPIGVAEVMLPEVISPAVSTPPNDLDALGTGRVQVWTRVAADTFPAPMPGYSPAAALLLPWWCRARGAEAAILPGFNAWSDDGRDEEVLDAAEASRILAWPEAGSLAPSVRMERIREGQQAYAYAVMALKAGIRGDWVSNMPVAFDAIALGQVPSPGELDALLENYVAWRVEAGRVLENFARKQKEDAS